MARAPKALAISSRPDIAPCDTPSGLTDEDGRLLLDLAEVAIRACVEGTRYPGPDERLLSDRLRRPCCAFVSLYLGRELHGCHGSLGDAAPIGGCVPRLAIGAAFDVRRGIRLRRTELKRMHLQISIVDRRVALPAATREEVLRRIRAGHDGLSLATPSGRGVVLPSVWQYRADPDDVVDLLLERAGLDPDVWPCDATVERLETTEFGRFLR